MTPVPALLLLLALSGIISGAVLQNSLRQAQTSSRENAFQRDPVLLDNALTLQERISDAGCVTDVCFALDGSLSVGAIAFEQAREFSQVLAIVADVDPRARFSALQFGLANSAISNLTTNATSFLGAVSTTPFVGASASFTAAGIFGCSRLLAPGRELQAARKQVVVVIGDGGGNFGRAPSRIADGFVAESAGEAAVLAVAVGRANRTALAGFATNGTALVDLTDTSLLANATKQALEFICELPPVVESRA